MERVGDLPVGHPGTLVEVDDGGLGIGSQLALGGPGGVTGLQRMPTADALAASLAVAAVDVELADDGPARDVGLELLVEMVLDDLTAAIGTLRGQRRLMGFIDLGGRRRLAVGVQAVLAALFAARLFGAFLGFPLGERSRLTLGGAFGFF